MAKRILIIEDDSTLREALNEWLVDEGYEVQNSPSVEDAFQKMTEVKPDLILTDLVMANMSGFDVLKYVKQNAHLSDVPVLIVSNSAQDGDVEKAMSMGARDFMVKSDHSLEEIVNRVKTVLAGVTDNS